MDQRRPSGRFRDQIARNHRYALVSTLRKIYGPDFAKGALDRQHLHRVLAKLDEPSMSQLVSDHEAGRLRDKIVDTRTSEILDSNSR